MSPPGTWYHFLVPRFPRVSGDEPLSEDRRDRLGVFSPRERG